LQFNVSRASAIMALRLCEDSEERADDLITALPSTKRFVQFLTKPALVHILKKKYSQREFKCNWTLTFQNFR
jgi:hypothetical protein